MMANLQSLILLSTCLNVTLTFGQHATFPVLGKEFEIKYFAKASWFNAHLSCLACGGRLASIESEAEHNYVVGLIRNLGLQNQSFWIAGTDLANEGIFNWFTTGDQLTYTNFAPEEPRDTGDEDCLHLWPERELKWNDTKCSNLCYFICENKPQC